MRSLSITSTLFVCLLLLLSSCDSVRPDDLVAGEEELITRVILTFTSETHTVTAEAHDHSGDGTEFEIDPIVLQRGKVYSGSIELLDDPNQVDITEEVAEEGDEHQFFYTFGGGVADQITLTVTDRDSNQLPIGLTFELDVHSGATATGTLNVVLSHFDEEPKNGVDRSDETDMNVTFPVTLN